LASELRIWTGVLAPAGTPREIVTKLNQAIRDGFEDADKDQRNKENYRDAGGVQAGMRAQCCGSAPNSLTARS